MWLGVVSREPKVLAAVPTRELPPTASVESSQNIEPANPWLMMYCDFCLIILGVS